MKRYTLNKWIKNYKEAYDLSPTCIKDLKRVFREFEIDLEIKNSEAKKHE